MIIFGIHCNFFIVLTIRLKTCIYNGFPSFTKQNVHARKIGRVLEALRAGARLIDIGCGICSGLVSLIIKKNSFSLYRKLVFDLVSTVKSPHGGEQLQFIRYLMKMKKGACASLVWITEQGNFSTCIHPKQNSIGVYYHFL